MTLNAMERLDSLDYFVSLLNEGKFEYSGGRLIRRWEARRGWLGAPRFAEKLTTNGYYLLRYSGGGNGSHSVMAHRAIWSYFNGPIPPGMEVNHKNGIKTDNRIENLELVTRSENVRHAKRNGMARYAMGLSSGRGKLSDEDVLQIKKYLGLGMKQQDIADMYGVRPNQISRINTGDRRANVTQKVKGLNEFQQASKRTLNGNTDKREAILNYTLGLGGEAAGEIGEMVKKAMFHGHELNHDKIAEELGDVMFYVAALATTLDLDLEDIANNNIQKLCMRYPSGFTVEDSVRRVDVNG